MAETIVKLSKDGKDYYLLWSSVSDGPRKWGVTLEELKAWYQEEYGRQGMKELEGRLERVERKGTSSYMDPDAEATLSFNRAGHDETCLTVDEIIEWYCIRKENPPPGVGKKRSSAGDE